MLKFLCMEILMFLYYYLKCNFFIIKLGGIGNKIFDVFFFFGCLYILFEKIIFL